MKDNFLKSDLRGKDLLYHFTSKTSAKSILDENTIKPLGKVVQIVNGKKGINCVSFTRNRNLKHHRTEIAFIIDREKLNNNYKLNPLDFWMVLYMSDVMRNSIKRNTKINAIRPEGCDGDTENEEFVDRSIDDFKKFIVGVKINSDQLDHKLINTLNELSLPIYDKNFDRI